MAVDGSSYKDILLEYAPELVTSSSTSSTSSTSSPTPLHPYTPTPPHDKSRSKKQSPPSTPMENPHMKIERLLRPKTIYYDTRAQVSFVEEEDGTQKYVDTLVYHQLKRDVEKANVNEFNNGQQPKYTRISEKDLDTVLEAPVDITTQLLRYKDPVRELLEGTDPQHPQHPQHLTNRHALDINAPLASNPVAHLIPDYFNAEVEYVIDGRGEYVVAPASQFHMATSIFIVTTLVERLLKPGSSQRELPVFITPQGCGKSSFLHHLLSGVNLFGAAMSMDRFKDLKQELGGQIATGRAGAIIFDELVGLDKNNKERFINLIGDCLYTPRLPYGKKPKQIEPCWLWAGAANPANVYKHRIFQAGENTRLLGIKLEGYRESEFVIEEHLPKNSLNILRHGLALRKELQHHSNRQLRPGLMATNLCEALCSWRPDIFKIDDLHAQIRSALSIFEQDSNKGSILKKLDTAPRNTTMTLSTICIETGINAAEEGELKTVLLDLVKQGLWINSRPREGEKRASRGRYWTRLN